MLQPADFLGHWGVTRTIEDRHSNQTGRFDGEATFVQKSSGALSYVETGQMRLGHGPSMTATRSYIWQFNDGRVDVFFEYGRPFHSFAPIGTSAGTDHPCGEDYYSVAYDFLDWPSWSAVWTVSGPRKDYTSSTIFKRD